MPRLRKRAWSRLATTCSATLTLALGLGVWALWWEQCTLAVRRPVLDLPRWPVALGGLRVALVADLHVGSPHWGLGRLEELVRTINGEHPDLILMAGDYLINEVAFGTWIAPEPIAEVLRGLDAPLGVIAVLGNHDWWNDGERIRHAFEQAGITVLENQSRRLVHNGQAFHVAGLADALTRRVDVPAALSEVPQGQPVLLLAHEPDVFAALGDRADLVLAGHTHGGQVALPLVGRLVIPSAYGQRYAYGHVEEGGRHLFVTGGVGTSIFPVRFGVPPEVCLLELR